MKILVTGGAGFIGYHTAKKLLELKHKVVVVDNLDPYYSVELKSYNLSMLQKDKNFKFVELDICDKQRLPSLCKKEKFDAIIHLAAKAGVRNSLQYPEQYFRVNVIGTLNILELSKNLGIKKLLIASSSSVYGINKKVPFSETDRVDQQISPYAASKKSLETLAYTYHHLYGLNIQLFRFFTVYGPSGRPDMAPFIFTDAISKGKEIKIFGSDQTERDYTFVADIVQGLTNALSVGDKFEIYNLGNDKPVKLAVFIQTLEKIIGKKAKTKIVESQAGDVSVTWANIDKAKHKLDYLPQTSLPEGLSKFYQWYEENDQLYHNK